MSVSINPSELTLTQTPDLVAVSLTLPGDFQDGTSQTIFGAKSDDTSIATVETLSNWQGDKVPGGTLSSGVRITPKANGATIVTVTVQVGVMPGPFKKATATIGVTVDQSTPT